MGNLNQVARIFEVCVFVCVKCPPTRSILPHQEDAVRAAAGLGPGGLAPVVIFQKRTKRKNGTLLPAGFGDLSRVRSRPAPTGELFGDFQVCESFTLCRTAPVTPLRRGPSRAPSPLKQVKAQPATVGHSHHTSPMRASVTGPAPPSHIPVRHAHEESIPRGTRVHGESNPGPPKKHGRIESSRPGNLPSPGASRTPSRPLR
jgi:hypothetical protein